MYQVQLRNLNAYQIYSQLGARPRNRMRVTLYSPTPVTCRVDLNYPVLADLALNPSGLPTSNECHSGTMGRSYEQTENYKPAMFTHENHVSLV